MLPNSICQALQHVLNAQANVQPVQDQILIVILASLGIISHQPILAVHATCLARHVQVLMLNIAQRVGLTFKWPLTLITLIHTHFV